MYPVESRQDGEQNRHVKNGVCIRFAHSMRNTPRLTLDEYDPLFQASLHRSSVSLHLSFEI